MTQALQRIVQVRAGPPGGAGRQFGNSERGGAGLHIEFATRAAAVGRPAECDITIYNLARDSVDLFSDPKNFVQVRVGHRSTAVRQVFAGNPTRDTLKLRKQGGDIAMSVTLRDGGHKYDTGRLDVSLSGQTTARQVFDEILAQSGLGEGQVDLGTHTWPRRYVFNGTTKAALDDLVDSVGPTHSWFIRDGNVYILEKSQKTPETGPVFSSENGNLIGSPEPVKGGRVRIKGVLDATLRVGRVVRLESKWLTGYYKLVEVNFMGSNFGNQFYVEMKGVPYAVQ